MNPDDTSAEFEAIAAANAPEADWMTDTAVGDPLPPGPGRRQHRREPGRRASCEARAAVGPACHQQPAAALDLDRGGDRAELVPQPGVTRRRRRTCRASSSSSRRRCRTPPTSFRPKATPATPRR